MPAGLLTFIDIELWILVKAQLWIWSSNIPLILWYLEFIKALLLNVSSYKTYKLLEWTYFQITQVKSHVRYNLINL